LRGGDPELQTALLHFKVPCLVCGKQHHPVRARESGTRLYFSASCGEKRCARSRATSAELKAVAISILERENGRWPRKGQGPSGSPTLNP
jgi:hypothetical protein